jgi:hypothetical protein
MPNDVPIGIEVSAPARADASSAIVDRHGPAPTRPDHRARSPDRPPRHRRSTHCTCPVAYRIGVPVVTDEAAVGRSSQAAAIAAVSDGGPAGCSTGRLVTNSTVVVADVPTASAASQPRGFSVALGTTEHENAAVVVGRRVTRDRADAVRPGELDLEVSGCPVRCRRPARVPTGRGTLRLLHDGARLADAGPVNFDALPFHGTVANARIDPLAARFEPTGNALGGQTCSMPSAGPSARGRCPRPGRCRCRAQRRGDPRPSRSRSARRRPDVWVCSDGDTAADGQWKRGIAMVVKVAVWS